MRENLVVVGNGMAGMRTVEELLKLAPERYHVTVFGAEPHGNYNRILLSDILAGRQQFARTFLHDRPWYETHGIRLHAGRTVLRIDRVRRQVIADGGIAEPYDRLLLATGSVPIRLPIPGAELEGVVTFRDIADVEAMLAASKVRSQAVVIGGGLLGLEAANGLMAQGMTARVVHLVDTLMERQLDATAGNMLRRSLEARGMAFELGAQTVALLGDRRVRAVRLADGRELPADLVVMAVGIRPNIALAQEAGLYCERGVVVTDTLQTYDPRIYAVGECVQHRRATYGLVAPLFEMARVCANHLAELAHNFYAGAHVSAKLKVTGIELFSAGDFAPGPAREEITLQDETRGVYKKIVVEDDRLRGVVLYGDTTDATWYFDMLRSGRDVSDLREQIVFGQTHLGDAGTQGLRSAADLPDAAEICGCNGVCKGEIVQAIASRGLMTLEDVRAHTKASSSCGSCTGLVEQILAATLGGAYSPPKAKTLCACTEFTHEEVRKAVQANGLKSIAEAMAFMEWRTPDGCAACRPALNYYLLAAWPGEAKDDPRSRFINERAHANIQKDGTFSVVPRMWGGITTPAQLRAIADAAEKFQVPTVKITGGQRIDLLGVKKEQLPAIWHDLGQAGLVSGHAYGKALRTVKTCVGSEWCRFGTQDSTAMGIRLEQRTWGSWMPHKFKMAVSGCPRNCAEATIKDFGVIAVESGWELHVGGNGGMKVRVTELLCKVETPAEVEEYCSAFIQLYREEARYLERTAPWIERVGLKYVKDRIVEDADGRRALNARFLQSQADRSDPWQARAAQQVDRNEFTPLRGQGLTV
ncbi:MAG: NAD(P)/FAD-dependent oxidoreductase [Candidatus Lambdaproteobacteria bacterium]|nr:NAD(P)/FAD-dependent oxidoreductase [Candidatus Lambdaproteobacteria bacterium]